MGCGASTLPSGTNSLPGGPSTLPSGASRLPGGFSKGSPVHFCAANHTFPSGDKLEYGAKGEVTGPSQHNAEKEVAVRFPGNKGDIDCSLVWLSRTWPPPPLPEGWKVDEEAYYIGESHPHPENDGSANDCHYTHGEKGVVTSAGILPGKLQVRFPSNPAALGCFLTELSRTPPSDGAAHGAATPQTPS